MKESPIEQPSNLSPSQFQVRVHATALDPVGIQAMGLQLRPLPYMSGDQGVGCEFSYTVLRVDPEAGLKE